MKILSDNEFLNTVESSFKFLFDSGFKIIKYEHQVRHVFFIHLEGHCQIEIGSDIDGHVYLLLAVKNIPHGQGNDWFSLSTVIYMLTGKKINLDYLDDNLDQDFVIKTLSTYFHLHLEKILSIFREGEIDKHKSQLQNLRKELNKI